MTTRKKATTGKATTQGRRTRLTADVGPGPSAPAFVVTGTIWQTGRQQPAQGVRVTVFDRDIGGEQLLGAASTDANGQYSVTYTDQQFRRTAAERTGADLFIRVTGDAGLAVAQSTVVRNAGPNARLDLELGTGVFLVRGTVLDSNSKPMPGIRVRAVDRDLRNEQPLGEAVTDADGRFEIRYGTDRFARSEKSRADLVVRAFDPAGGGEGTLLVQSDTLFNAPAVADVVLTAPPDSNQSEYERYVQSITPLLDGVQLSDVQENAEHQDITFLTNETGIARQHLEWLARAARESLSPLISTDFRVNSHVAQPVPPSEVVREIWYGWFRQGLVSERAAVLAVPSDRLIATLRESIAQRIIPQLSDDLLKTLASAIDQVHARTVLTPSAAGGAASIGDVLDVLPPELSLGQEERARLASALADVNPAADRWSRVASAVGASSATTGALLQAAALRRITSGDVPLLKTTFAALPRDGRLSAMPAISAVAILRADDWKSSLKAAGNAADDGALDTIASDLERRTAEIMPVDFLMAASLRAPSADALGRFLQSPDGSDGRQQVDRLARRYDGLELGDVFARDEPADTRAEEAGRRIGLLAKVYAQNPDVDFLALDYFPGGSATQIAFDGIADGDRRLVLNVLRAHARTQQLTANAQDSERLLDAGYSSAFRILEAGADKVYAESGLDHAALGRVMARAADVASLAASPLAFTLFMTQFIGLGIGWTIASPAQPKVADFFTEIPGFADLFGRQSVCRCQHCQSVLSPAAYFVDLMWFVEKKITRKAFVGSPNSPFRLKGRRPDLWDLPLTCANTDDLVPTLDVANDILERYIASLISSTATAFDVYRKLALETGSLEQPFNLPLARISLLLGHFRRTRADVARALGDSGEAYARTRIGLAVVEWDLIARSRASDTAFLKLLFDPAIVTNLTPTTEIDVQLLIARAGWTRRDLGTLLLDCATVTGGAAVAFHSRKSSSDSIQNDLEVVTGLTPQVLDRLHRFRRLAMVTGWTFDALELVLQTLRPLGTPMSAAQLTALADFQDVQARFGIEVDEVCALAGPIPSTGVGGRTALFDRLFNLQPFVDQQGPWPAANAPVFTHPAFVPSGASTPDNRTLQRLLAGLQLTDADLVTLLGGLGLASTASPSVALTIDNLALLHRHARLAGLLDISVKHLLALMRYAGVGRGTPPQLHTLEHVTALLSAYDAWRASGYTLDDVAFVLTGVASTDSHPRAGTLARAVLERLSREKPFEFGATLLTGVPGISEDQSKQILAFNTADSAVDALTDKPFERAPGSSLFRLRAGVDPAAPAWTINLPSGFSLPAGITIARVTQAFQPYDPLEAVAGALAAAGGVDRDKLTELLTLTVDSAGVSQPLTTNRTGIVTALYTQDQTAFETALFGSRGPLLRLLVLFGPAEWNAAALETLNDGFAATPAVPVVFAGATAVSFDWRSIVEAGTYLRLARASVDSADPVSIASSPQRLAAALGASDLQQTGNDAILAAAFRTDALRVAAVRPHLSSSVQALRPIARLSALLDVLTFASSFGASGETLRQMVPQIAVPPFDPNQGLVYAAALQTAAADEYATLARAADGLYGIIRTTYPDEQTFQNTVEPYDDISRGRRRDALVEFLLRPSGVTSPRQFRSVSDLFGYFLIDVEVGGCARTSKIVAATLSVQLYVQRVLMQLESAMWNGVPDAGRAALDYVSGQWTWRKNYRVWEANRKVFLYPENYLEPDLRDDKTPIFKDLEQSLLQNEVTESTASDAYSGYLDGFETITRLNIAGAFHDVSTDSEVPKDILHVIGMTSDDPPLYYHRAISQLLPDEPLAGDPPAVRYGAWRKLDVQIPAPYATPIVFAGRLHMLWLEITTAPKNSLLNGNNVFVGYTHRFKLKFSSLKPDGAWTPPQDTAFVYGGNVLSQSLNDLLDPPMKISSGGSSGSGSSGSSGGGTASNIDTGLSTVVVLPGPTQFLGVTHSPIEAKDNYALRGPVWTKVYAEVQSDLVPGTTDSRIMLRAIGQDLTAQKTTSIGVYGQLYGALDLFAHVCDFSVVQGAFGLLGRWLRLGNKALELQTFPQIPARFDNRFRFSAVPLAEAYPGGSLEKYADIVGFRDAQPVNRESHRPISGGTADTPLDAICAAGRHTLLIRISPDTSGAQVAVLPIGTTLRDVLSRRLFSEGVPGLLDTTFQADLEEDPLPLANASAALLVPESPRDPFKGAHAIYFRELFFEIPYATALALNAQQQFAAAQRWFHFLFDPTSRDNGPQRVWRYLPFVQDVGLPSLRETLTSQDALDAYRDDPFNPHAIARLRPGVHQRAVVMRYIDNLLDWGDSLFTEFTMESLNEATMLYVLAADILGPRPPDIGECGEDAVRPRTYATIENEALEKGASDFLVELELLVSRTPRLGIGAATPRKAYDVLELRESGTARMARAALAVGAADGGMPPSSGSGGMFAGLGFNDPGGMIWRSAGGTPLTVADQSVGASTPTPTQITALEPDRAFGARGPINPGNLAALQTAGQVSDVVFGEDTLIPFDYQLPAGLDKVWRLPAPPDLKKPVPDPRHTPNLDVVEQVATKVPVFCVPPNEDLLAYWDRVEDRLNKIRNCMDITGASRRPSLFAPEIDPALLARLRAAGLPLDQAIAATNASVPPYRFSYLIEKARQHLQAVQSLSSALMSSLERKDIEELAQLRAVQEKNVLAMRRRILELDVASAQATSASLQKKQELLQYKAAFFAQLQAVGRIPEEQAEQSARSFSAGLREQEAAFGILAGILGLIPNLGAPFAITYGGVQLKGTAAAFLNALRSGGALADVLAEMSGREAAYARRLEEWQHQEQLALREQQDIAQQIAAADARITMAQRALEVHQQTIDQADEILNFYRDKFTSHGLFTWLSTRLHRLHREAFNAAFAVAQMAERAFLFERVDDGSVRLSLDYWDAARGGLGAADALMLDLHQLEQRFLETNYRTLEIEQSFSLAQLNPRALVMLRATGACSFQIPELAFDVPYPGHYRRRIKAVRLTIPCVTGPYVNVGATLKLTGSRMRATAKSDDPLTEIPLRHTTAVAVSGAQNDAGVFEFTFRDDRYMPFEGAGAISDWEIALPATFRVFDYDSLSDVILRIAYTAESDDALKDAVETVTSTSARAVRNVLGTTGIRRMVSVRHDFPDLWRALVTSPPGSALPFELSAARVPFFASRWLSVPGVASPKLHITLTAAVLQTIPTADAPTAQFSISSAGGSPVSLQTWNSLGPRSGYYEAPLANLAVDLAAAQTGASLSIALTSPGNLAPVSGTGSRTAIDDDTLRDLLLLMTIKTTP